MHIAVIGGVERTQTTLVRHVNSHGAVKVAWVACQKLGREMVLTKRLGTRDLVRRLSPAAAA